MPNVEAIIILPQKASSLYNQDLPLKYSTDVLWNWDLPLTPTHFIFIYHPILSKNQTVNWCHIWLICPLNTSFIPPYNRNQTFSMHLHYSQQHPFFHAPQSFYHFFPLQSHLLIINRTTVPHTSLLFFLWSCTVNDLIFGSHNHHPILPFALSQLQLPYYTECNYDKYIY